MGEYSTVTELPGHKASKEQIERLFHRYHFASTFCIGKDILEVACGAGMGLGYLERFAKKVIGGDIDENILELALKQYRGRNKIELRKLDAQKLLFSDKSFDVVILYEAIYYLAQPEKFIEEAFRVLKKDGVLIICLVNKDWPDFNLSPFSTKYFSASELYRLLNFKFSDVKLYGAFPIQADSLKGKIISLIKRGAVKLHLIPKTMKKKEFFKRLFFGSLVSIPSEIEEGLAEYIPPVPISFDSSNSQFKVLYAVARI
jgi:ubiquinone/menaquinone biosynthesis C-methylase UbiE